MSDPLDILSVMRTVSTLKHARGDRDKIDILVDRETATKFQQHYAKAMYYYWHHFRRYRRWLKSMEPDEPHPWLKK